jgi:hypothetical protein
LTKPGNLEPPKPQSQDVTRDTLVADPYTGIKTLLMVDFTAMSMSAVQSKENGEQRC